MYKKTLCTVLMTFALPVLAAPKSDLWEFWQDHDPASTQTVSHMVWDDFLKAHISEVDGINLLNYGAVPSADQQALQAYIVELASVAARSLNRNEQRAYWINLYNALTVDLILKNYPVESIRDVSTGLFSGGPWSDEIVIVEEQTLTLNDIEHRILRPIWQDARLHYAVNCASFGCPNLARDAFTATNAEDLLNAGARAYVNHPRGAQVQSGELHVSSIYVWFQEDFDSSQAGVIAHLTEYAQPELANQLAGIKKITGDSYDWSLNAP